MQEFTDREQISLLMMRGWSDRQRSYKEVDFLFIEAFRSRKIDISNLL